MKLFRRIFTIGVVLLLLFATGTFVFISLYGDEIKSTIISSLNRKLNTKVDVKEVDINFWDEFPSASLSFKNVVIYSSSNSEDTLLSTDVLNASFNLIEFYKRNFELIGISLKNGKCAVELDENGTPNYLIFKEDSSQHSKFHFVLNKINLENIAFSYMDLSNNINLDFSINDGIASGNFTDSIYDLTIESNLINCSLESNNWEILNDRTIQLKGISQINNLEKSISFSQTTLKVEDFDIRIDGSINYSDKTKLDLSLSTENQDLKSAVSVLPVKIKSFLSDYLIEGEAYVSGFLKGEFSSISNPSYRFNFDVTNGNLAKTDGKVAFNNSFIKGSIENGSLNNLESTKLTLDRFESTMLNGNLKGDLILENFNKPKYSLNLSTDMNLVELISFSKEENIQNSKGKIVSSFSLRGKMKSINSYDIEDFKSAQLKGQLSLKSIAFDELKSDYKFNNVNGFLEIANNQCKINKLEFVINDQVVNIKGKLINLIPFTYEKNEKLIADIDLISDNLNLNRIIKNSSERSKFNFAQNITVYLKSNVKQLSKDRFRLNNFKSDIFLNQERIDIRNCGFETLEGKIEGDFFLKKNSKGFKFITVSKLKAVNISELFETFDSFGQSEIQSKNISGDLTADIHANLSMNEYLEIIPSSIKNDADFIIENGRLKDVKAIEAFSNHIDLDELKDIKFKTIQNQIFVENEKIFIPKMTVHSSALELTMYGDHSFSNEINYHFTLLLNEVLGKKVKQPENNEFGYVEDDGLGRTKIFVKMFGTVDNPQFAYDSKELKKHLKKEVETEKKTIKKLLNEEFGLFKNDTTYRDIDIEKPKKKSPFTIEWEENGNKALKSKSESKPESSNKTKKKGKLGKFIDKIAKPNEDEFVDPPDEK